MSSSIVVMLLTYDRIECAKRTMQGIAKNLQAFCPIWMHIADDGSSQEYRDELFAFAHGLFGENVSITNSERRGYGGNYNKATQLVHSIAPIILPLEDDWELARELDVGPIVKVLEAGIFRCVRLGYIGYTHDLKGIFRWYEGFHWLELDPDSAEKHVFTGGPRLETVGFERAVGPWPQGMEQGQTELEVCGRDAARQGVAWPIGLIKPSGDAFLHIGTYKAGFDPTLGSQPTKGSVVVQAE